MSLQGTAESKSSLMMIIVEVMHANGRLSNWVLTAVCSNTAAYTSRISVSSSRGAGGLERLTAVLPQQHVAIRRGLNFQRLAKRTPTVNATGMAVLMILSQAPT